MTLRTLNYGNYGIFFIMGNAGFCPSSILYILWPQSTYIGTTLRPMYILYEWKLTIGETTPTPRGNSPEHPGNDSGFKGSELDYFGGLLIVTIV